MARHQTSFPEILDVSALRARCDFIASAHAEQREPMRRALLAAFKEANVAGRAKARELLAADGAGIKCAERISWLQDQLITLLHDFVLNQIFDAAKAPEASRIAVTAVGGYGRGTLAPGSDIDLLFLLPAKKAVWAEPAIEFML
jgi:[protein-PII] uridylyltransferase